MNAIRSRIQEIGAAGSDKSGQWVDAGTNGIADRSPEFGPRAY